MGVINLTPDSFSDGGDFNSPKKVLYQVNQFMQNGVDIVDLGAQSTRPGAEEVGSNIEIKRLIPYLKLIKSEYPEILISIDTFNSEVAHEALLNGANWINDVTGGRRDKNILDVVSKFNCPFVITHSRGNSQNMNQFSRYENVLSEVKCSIENLIKNALEKNIPKKNIIVDPGIGFSKDINQNLEILRNLDVFKKLNLPILIGASRKRFIGEILNELDPKERDVGTLAISCLCSHFNIDIVRVHNVKMNSQILKVADKIYRR
ncbi:Dihydropteroate synthase [Prochlorococcus marinus str. MIT 9107]|uniref:Dihydropteroate synthase n=2 Tax=Prochlorococcaceae TaxID=2881426 RepID=A0A0A1ZQG0_PROMR|nr:Dihydropteroate synthase [Prochlorococcus marinus str. MIT 9107]KGF90479.1 Dihydropteroate synthase [Prochlorococcus marinus str. MIT 9116]KGF92958.1 Dihydropteroate synthase [Prochlorococcus marinus str. MIT 9123]